MGLETDMGPSQLSPVDADYKSPFAATFKGKEILGFGKIQLAQGHGLLGVGLREDVQLDVQEGYRWRWAI